MAYLVERNGWMYIAYPDPEDPAHEKRTSLKTRDRAKAETIVADYNGAERWDLLGLPSKSKRQNPFLSELFEQYLKYSKEHKQKKTYINEKIYIEKFLAPHFGQIRVRDLRDEHIESFVGRLKNWTVKNKKGEDVPAPYHPETINKRLKCLRIILKRAARPGGPLDKLPVAISEHLLTVPKGLPKYITPDQFAIWWSHITKPLNKWRAVLELNTGIPDSELAKLRWDRNYNEYHHSLRYWRGKTKTEIVIPLNLWAREAIEELKKMKKGPYLFHGIQDMQKAYEVASENSGIKVSPHMLRHSFATWALSAGEAMAKIQQIMGHAEISTTQIYAKVLPQFMAETMDAIDRMRPPSTLPGAPENGTGAISVQTNKPKGPVNN